MRNRLTAIAVFLGLVCLPFLVILSDLVGQFADWLGGHASRLSARANLLGDHFD